VSHSHIRATKLPRRRPWIEIPLIAGFTVLTALFLFITLASMNSDRRFSTANGKVMETRIVVDHTRESFYGGYIFYRIEAHTNYLLNGQPQERWLTASEVTEGREQLELKLATHPKTCLVYWPPDHPENAKCDLK
jgi:hypothetical protein